MKKWAFLLVAIVISLWGIAQCNNADINIAKKHFYIDDEHSLIVSHLDSIFLNQDYSSLEEVSIQFGYQTFNFVDLDTTLNYRQAYPVTRNGSTYQLYFTPLPLISIEADSINKLEKRPAEFSYADQQQVLSSDIGIKFRGHHSMSFPKKNYSLEFWKDDDGDETDNVQFGNMRSDDDWILKSLYNEPLRMRSYISSKLWLDMHQLYYQDEEPKARSGADVMYVEVFINGKYEGIYNLSEKIDKKQLQLKSYKNNEIRGELYKGVYWKDAVTFDDAPDYDNDNRLWSGYEMRYPKEKDITDWSNLYQFTDFVVNASDQDFINDIWNRFHYDNFVDYYLFINFLYATDNHGNNLYVARYKKGAPYFYVPWDLDCTFGLWWNGSYAGYDCIVGNHFHTRVDELNVNNYHNYLSAKWFQYRTDLLEKNRLINLFKNRYKFLKDNKMYERESLVYSNYDFSTEDLSSITNWVENRLDFLDQYFTNLSTIEDEEVRQTVLYPNPVKGDKIYLKNYEKLSGKSYQIYNALGCLKASDIIQNQFISIDNLESGTYFIRIDGLSHKIIIL